MKKNLLAGSLLTALTLLAFASAVIAPTDAEAKPYEMPMVLEMGVDKVTAYGGVLTDGSRSWVERSEAARVLGRSGDERAVTMLIDALTGDKNAFVRREAALGLGTLGDKRAIDSLTEALNDENEWVRDFAKESLEKLK